MHKIIDQLIDDVSNGQFLSASLDKFKNVFGEFAVNIIRVGESSGILHENLTYLAEELKKKQQLKKNVVGALIYPAIILMATSGIIGLLTFYVFPKILPIFKNMNMKLPITTRILIALIDFLMAYGIHVAVGIAAIIIISSILIARVKIIKILFHRMILSIPLVGKIARNYNITNFSRTLGLLLKSDIKVVEALTVTSSTLTNKIYQNNIREIAGYVSKGEEISRYLSTRTDLFPIVLSQMIAIGERTGNLSETLVYLSEYYEEELNDLTKNLTTALEPIMMIVLGLIVGFIALSIIMPIYGFSNI